MIDTPPITDATLLAAAAASAWVVAVALAVAVPVGVGMALAIDGHGRRGRWARRADIAMAALAGVPSVVYGVIGLALFVRGLGIADMARAGAATLVLLLVPAIANGTREALRVVPLSRREASLALGATNWQTTWHRVLPDARSGLLAGLFAVVARALGEASPLIVVGAALAATRTPDAVSPAAIPLPVLIFEWASSPDAAWRAAALPAVLLLLALALPASGLAVWLRDRDARRRSA